MINWFLDSSLIRSDLFEELENGKDIEELLFQMIDEELNDDVFDTDLLN